MSAKAKHFFIFVFFVLFNSFLLWNLVTRQTFLRPFGVLGISGLPETFASKKHSVNFRDPSTFSLATSSYQPFLFNTITKSISTSPSMIGQPNVSPFVKLVSDFTDLEVSLRTKNSLASPQSSQQPSVSFKDRSDAYQRNLLSFSKAEENSIKNVINSQEDLKNVDWTFFKKNDSLDLSESFILDDEIYLSQKDAAVFIQIKSNEDDEDTDIKLSFMINMLIYRLQLLNPAKYTIWYRQMNFTEIKSLTVPPDIERRRYSDPNVPKSEWAFAYNEKYYWMTRVIDDTFSVVTVAYLLVPSGVGFLVTSSTIDIQELAEQIGVDAGKLHHPACILASNPIVLHAEPDETETEPPE